jgi:glycosyltransferase involved in cell wall biosynthesis
MHITFLLPGYPGGPSGGSKVVYQYASELVRRGHRVTVVHPRTAPGTKVQPAANLYRWFRRQARTVCDRFQRPRFEWVTIDPRVRLTYVPELAPRYLPNAAALFATAWNTAQPVLDLPPRKGAKFYLIQHYETWSGPKECVDTTWRLPLNQVVIARWLYEKGIELGCEARDMRYITLGLDHGVFRLLQAIARRPARVAMMFSAQEWKGSAEGVQVLEIAKSHHRELQAILFGECLRPDWLPNWIEYRRRPPLRLLADEIYNGCSSFLSPSWYEGWPAPPAEAMACGCAVAMTDCKGSTEYAENEVNALVSPPRDVKALTKNLMRLLDDESLRQGLATRGNERIKQFTWQRSTDLLEKYLYERC